MASYIVTYQLNKEGQDYSGLYNEIEERYPTHCWVATSTWVVRTSDSALRIRLNLTKYVDSNDRLLVFKLAEWSEVAYQGIDTETEMWIKSNA